MRAKKQKPCPVCAEREAAAEAERILANRNEASMTFDRYQFLLYSPGSTLPVYSGRVQPLSATRTMIRGDELHLTTTFKFS